MTAAQKRRLLNESKVAITDNEIGSLLHHCDDAMEYLQQGKKEALMASLNDIKELGEELSKKLSKREFREL